jgi:MFS superfamily sulfate permease-like transporter
MKDKIFTENQIWTGTMLGGPLAAGYYLYSNFKIFGEYDKTKISIIISLITTLVLLFILPQVPKNMPKMTVPLLYTGITYVIVKKYQKRNIEKHIENNGELNGWIRTIIISIISLVITIVIALAPIGIKYWQIKSRINQIENIPKLQSAVICRKYGIQEIHFDEKNISKDIIDEFSKALYDVEIFNDKIRVFVYIMKENDEYNFYFNSSLLNMNIFHQYNKMRELMRDKKIRFRFFEKDLNNVDTEMFNTND